MSTPTSGYRIITAEATTNVTLGRPSFVGQVIIFTGEGAAGLNVKDSATFTAVRCEHCKNEDPARMACSQCDGIGAVWSRGQHAHGDDNTAGAGG